MVNHTTQITGKAMSVLLGVGLILSTFFIQEGFKEFVIFILGIILIWLGAKD